jgi:hypothetical protein
MRGRVKRTACPCSSPYKEAGLDLKSGRASIPALLIVRRAAQLSLATGAPKKGWDRGVTSQSTWRPQHKVSRSRNIWILIRKTLGLVNIAVARRFCRNYGPHRETNRVSHHPVDKVVEAPDLLGG